jgi:amino-acid N-acetyltransferase
MIVPLAPARPSDFAELSALLHASGLPLDGLEEHLETALVARRDGRLVGCVALEIYGPVALLRSLAIASDLRGEGLGQRLTEAALDLARAAGVKEVFLLTQTAAGFFPRFGFVPAAREQAPPALQQSVEFRSACPASAACMRLTL